MILFNIPLVGILTGIGLNSSINSQLNIIFIRSQHHTAVCTNHLLAVMVTAMTTLLAGAGNTDRAIFIPTKSMVIAITWVII